MNSDIEYRLNELNKIVTYRKTPYGRFPTKGGDGGDDCLWLGLLSSVGVEIASQGIIQCQSQRGEKRQGMIYRNPDRRSNDSAGYSHYFSRDMALGVLCHLARNGFKNKTLAKNWLNYIYENSGKCKIKKPKWLGGGCMVRELYKYAPDDRSDITPQMWAMMKRVWEGNNWPTTNEMRKWEKVDGDIWLLSVEETQLGYQSHLKAVQCWIKYLLNQSKTTRLKASKILYEKQPDNLFYKLLSQERAYSEDIERWLKLTENCSSYKTQDNWCWEKSDQTHSTKNYCGWDMIFLGNMITKLNTVR